jgi:AP2-associated kinase
MATFASPMAARGPFAPNAIAPAHAAPPGTFTPGTKVQVGNVRVVIEKYLSEGGFAHVYVVQLPKSVDGTDKGVLKRVAVPDKENLANMRTEVETMKRLRGRSKIVKYFDSHASQLKGGGYEVFLLMEFCQGGGLIDFMNTRLQNRLTEPEILKIFTDVSEGVADMHYLKPPLLHRDLKVENVLISVSGSSKTFKLCDFGSTAPPRPAATTAAEGRLIEDDVQRHTTLQYRSPEMIDVYRKQPIDEKSDIWALGVLLYKLCYYTTPFEEVGQMAILNASFKYPGYPRFSDGLKLLIASMLRENPTKRPNIYQVLSQACGLQGKPVPIKDIYTGRAQSETATRQQIPNAASTQSKTGATLVPPPAHTGPSVPDIAPMRRGRPDKPASHHGSAKPSPSPLRMIDHSDGSDPFAALDGGKAQAGDEISDRFPTLDQFSLLTDTGKKFEFEGANNKAADKTSDLSQRVTYALADDAFARPSSPVKSKPPVGDSVARAQALTERKKAAESKALPSVPKPSASVPVPQRAGRMPEGAKPSSSPPKSLPDPYANRPIHRFPSHDDPPKRSISAAVPHKTRTMPANAGSRLANLLREDAAQSDAAPSNGPTSPTSSRPSLEGGRPTMRDLDSSVHRSRSLNMRTRPVSVNMGAHPTHIRDREITNADYTSAIETAEPEMIPLTAVESEKNIHSDVDFLKAREEEERLKNKGHHKRLSSGSQHGKRTSLPSMGLSAVKGTTNLLTGRFGDAFKRFEGHNDHSDRSRHHRHSHHKRHSSSSPIRDSVLTPIAGSEATDLSEDRSRLELMETEELSPEMRRELEKLQLEAEEKRVANAAAEYRKRTGEKGGGKDAGRAANIQNKVQSLLQKENQEPTVQKTATGYGRFTDLNGDVQASRLENPVPAPIPAYKPSDQRGREMHAASAPPSSTNIAAQNSGMASSRTQRPMAPPKPQVLRTGGSTAPLQGTPNTVNSTQPQPGSPGDDWEENFSKRYPSLSGLEMVEADLGADQRSKLPSNVRIREV